LEEDIDQFEEDIDVTSRKCEGDTESQPAVGGVSYQDEHREGFVDCKLANGQSQQCKIFCKSEVTVNGHHPCGMKTLTNL
jgi:hypothetical protein